MKKKLRSDFTRRQHMLSKDYEVFYYHDTKHMNVEPHAHSHHEFYVYLEGDVDFELDGRRRPLRRGDCIFVCPGMIHRAYLNDPEGTYRRFVFWVTDKYLRELLRNHPDIGYVEPLLTTSNLFHTDNAAFQGILGKVLRALEEIHGNVPGREFAIDICVQDLLLMVARVAYEQINRDAPRGGKDLARSIADYIDRHLEEDLTLDGLADVFFASKYHIAHVFKDRFGISIHQYLIKMRLAACRDAIIAGEKISEAYEQYGFRDYPGFFRAFKKEFGLSPKEYREMYTIQGLTDRQESTS